jgi:oxygen-independent coproporphyrinogen-3 oxidase
MAKPGLYVHVPFCIRKCFYCDFYSEANLKLQQDYLVAVLQEAVFYKGQFQAFDSLYIGGGTPTCLPGRQLFRLIRRLNERLDFEKDLELTVEINPGDLTDDLLNGLALASVNRLSLGVQSFHDQELAFLGRRHNAQQAEQAIGRIRSTSMDWGMDLIYALPGQSIVWFKENLDRVVRLNPDHISCYELTIAPGTPLGREVAKGRYRLADQDLVVEQYHMAHDVLCAAGYQHYEVSNYARLGSKRSRHNQKYWKQVPYLGLGPGAHSFQDQRRWRNHRDLSAYINALTRKQAPPCEVEELDQEQWRIETLGLAFRTTDGLDRSLLRSKDQPLLDELESAGHITLSGKLVQPTATGMLLADAISCRLV